MERVFAKIAASAFVLSSIAHASFHNRPGSLFVGDNPEARILKAEDSESQNVLNDGTRQLAARLATLSLCTADFAYQGDDPSTLEWYIATAYSKWNDELLAKFPPSTELKFDRAIFESAFKAEVARRTAAKNVSQSIKAESEYFSAFLQGFTAKVYDRDTSYGVNSTASLQTLTSSERPEFYANVKRWHAESKDLTADCSTVKRGSPFWSKYSFLNVTRKRFAEKTLRKTPSLVERVVPTKRVTGNTESLIDIAYSGTQVFRDRYRNVVKDKSDTDSIGRCAMYVAIALQKSGCMPRFSAPMSGGDSRAYLIGQPLKENGFTNIMEGGDLPNGIKNLYDVPAGAVLVYSGGESGHVEIRTKSGFISDYFSTNPRTGAGGAFSARGRKLIGIYVKPSCGAGRAI